jgi:hypothetical protein
METGTFRLVEQCHYQVHYRALKTQMRSLSLYERIVALLIKKISVFYSSRNVHM